MNRGEIAQAARRGALAGLAGGLAFGASMIQLGVLPTVASIVRTGSPVVGFAVHMSIAATVGAGLGVLIARQRPGAGETLFWGLAYGTFWWFLGSLTLLPLFTGRSFAWSVAAAREQFPALVGHLVYGATAALALVILGARRHDPGARRLTRGVGVRGVLGGLIGAWLLAATLDAQNGNPAPSAVMTGDSAVAASLSTLLLGAVAGLGFAALYPRPTGGAGPMLVRGTAYGFGWWVVGALTVVPLLDRGRLAWSLAEARASFAALPGYLLFLGAATALAYKWLSDLARTLFSGEARVAAREGAGAQGLRALGRGAIAGLAGGLLFTIVMAQIGFLPTVARLVGSRSATTGLVVHLLIAQAIGASYGIFFRRQTYDVGSALGWGVSYGLFWWLMGPLTLLPVLLGGSPHWTVAAAEETFPALVGHIAYGAGLGVTFHRLESRHNPWWVARSQAEAARALQRREHVLTAAPALWSLMTVIALTVPILLGE